MNLYENIKKSLKEGYLEDRLDNSDIAKIVDVFDNIVSAKKLNPDCYVSDRNMGSGGTARINDDYYIKLAIFPYPRGVFIELLKQKDSWIMDPISDTVVEKYELRDFKDIDNETIPFVKESIDKIFKNKYLTKHK